MLSDFSMLLTDYSRGKNDSVKQGSALTRVALQRIQPVRVLFTQSKLVRVYIHYFSQIENISVLFYCI